MYASIGSVFMSVVVINIIAIRSFQNNNAFFTLINAVPTRGCIQTSMCDICRINDFFVVLKKYKIRMSVKNNKYSVNVCRVGRIVGQTILIPLG